MKLLETITPEAISALPSGDGQALGYNPTTGTLVRVPSAAAAVAGLGAKLSTFNPGDYGVVGAGGNDTAAFQAAIDAAQVSGGVVSVPKGTFSVETLSITQPYVTIEGRGVGATVLQSRTGNSVIAISGGTHDLSFAGFTANGTGSGTGCGIEVLAAAQFCFKVLFDRVECNNHGGHGFNIRSTTSSFNMVFDQCLTSGNALDGFRVVDSLGLVMNNCYAHTAAAGRAGFRLIGGGLLNGCNGIDSGAGVWGRFGGNGDAESDSVTSYCFLRMTGCNVEDFQTDGLEFKGISSYTSLDGCGFRSDDGRSGQRALNFLNGASDGTSVELFNSAVDLGSGSAWLNGNSVHVQSGSIALLVNRPGPATYYSVPFGMSVIANCVAAYNPTGSSYYGYSVQRLGGQYDIENLAGFGLGNGFVDGSCRYYGATAMPTSGTFARDVFVFKTGPTTVSGSASSRYTLLGWRRLVAGTAHVLNTDWVEVRCPTGT